MWKLVSCSQMSSIPFVDVSCFITIVFICEWCICNIFRIYYLYITFMLLTLYFIPDLNYDHHIAKVCSSNIYCYFFVLLYVSIFCRICISIFVVLHAKFSNLISICMFHILYSSTCWIVNIIFIIVYMYSTPVFNVFST